MLNSFLIQTMQIRIHLQHTGHPIANDTLYLSKVAARRSAFGTGADRAASVGMNMLPLRNSADSYHCINVGYVHSDDDFGIDPMCTNCPDLAPKG